LGVACAHAIDAGESGVMIAARGEDVKAVPLSEVVGKRKTVPLDHSWVRTARTIGVSLGDA
jgi:6-phosphofructokinase 1